MHAAGGSALLDRPSQLYREGMKASELTNLVIGLLVLVYVVSRQLQAKPAKTDMRLPVILGVIGIIQLTGFLRGESHHASEVAAALIGSLLLAAAFGAIRAATVHVWVDNGQTWRQGNWLTAALWIVSFAVHLGYDYIVDGRGPLSGLGNASLVLYIAITYAVQRFIIQARAQRISSAQNVDPETPISVRWP
jgi:hypothetical protein